MSATPTRSTSVPEESVPEIAKEIADTATRLVKLEIELIKQEAMAVAKRGAMGIGLAVGALLMFLFFIGQVAGTLSELNGEWVGWLIGAGVFLVLTIVLGLLALRLIKRAIAEGKGIASDVKTLPEVAKDTVAGAQAQWRSSDA